MPPDSTTFLQTLLDPSQWTLIDILTAIGTLATIAGAWFAYWPIRQQRRTQHLYELREKNSDKVVVDHATGLMCQQAGSPNYMTYVEAEKYLRDLNRQRLAGHGDWRVPTFEEAMSVMDSKRDDYLFLDLVFDRSQRTIWTSDHESVGCA